MKITVEICPICGRNEFKEVFKAPFFRGKRELFSIKECTNCNFWVTSPRPKDDDLGGYYEQESYVSHSDDNKSLFDLTYKTVRSYALKSKARLVNKCVGSKAAVLDFGAGGGAFVNQLKRLGYDAVGVEPSEIARKNAKTVYNLELLAPEQFNQMDKTYNAITLWHVLEHLPNLNNHLEKFYSALDNNGVLIIAVPNHESKDAKHYKENWAALDVPLHLWHFKKKNVKALAEKHRFKLEQIINMPFDSFYVSMLSEKIKGKARPIIGLAKGLQSNFAASSNNASSLIYVLRKP